MKRYDLLDTIRGITLISMILFHTCWDLCYFRMGITEEFLYGTGAYIWQQSICWTFILLSGFCFSLGRHPVKRGLLALGGGILITVVTMIVIPEERDLFGVLYLLGTATLLMTLLGPFFRKIVTTKRSALIALFLSIVLFFLTRNVNLGTFGFEGISFGSVPRELYRGYLMTFLGFPDPGFYSSDYFSLIPWFFLFTTGFFLHRIVVLSAKGDTNETIPYRLFTKGIGPFSFLGRHSLMVYMLHQAVIYGAVYLIYILIRS